jgi:type I restriction-modification system DNA methylase subunit
LQAIARLAHAGCRAGDLRVTPFNGRLFAPSRTPLADRRDLDDEAARRAVLALSTRPAPDRAGRERIAYRDLGVEQLGAVYETLLDYEPRIEPEPRRSVQSDRDVSPAPVGPVEGARPPAARPLERPRSRVSLVRGSSIRKATGSFYTPQPLADYLVRRTLGPLVRDAAPGDILRLRVVDPAMGSGAFLVAACRYLADAYETALLRTGGCAASDSGAWQSGAPSRSGVCTAST